MEVYRSPGQCRAARTVLTAPPGATILATLPTGEGKSLLFQLVDRVGFSESQGPGVTLVIVPTVTLAIDHEQSARKLPIREDRLLEQPLAYVGDETRKLQIREAIPASTPVRNQESVCTRTSLAGILPPLVRRTHFTHSSRCDCQAFPVRVAIRAVETDFDGHHLQ